jgi:hypothetical protein
LAKVLVQPTAQAFRPEAANTPMSILPLAGARLRVKKLTKPIGHEPNSN